MALGKLPREIISIFKMIIEIRIRSALGIGYLQLSCGDEEHPRYPKDKLFLFLNFLKENRRFRSEMKAGPTV